MMLRKGLAAVAATAIMVMAFSVCPPMRKPRGETAIPGRHDFS